MLKNRELLAAGELGEILYIDLTRINLGVEQSDADVFWELQPQDPLHPGLCAARDV
ncbi:hypothetical protein ACF046_01385 [Glutamicibacter creatinolyticus]|uniref:hypothetical protein n=1 Tax=Glutamicibacter creatinolyticus TaxID=162496 RepID=UPI0033D5BDA9